MSGSDNYTPPRVWSWDKESGSGFVEINPNSKIPAMLDRGASPPTRVFESGSIPVSEAPVSSKACMDYRLPGPRRYAEILIELYT